MQSVSSRIWTRVAVSISNDDNYYTTGTSCNTLNRFYCVESMAFETDNKIVCLSVI